MSEIVNQSLQKIAKGAGIIFIGTTIGMLLGFVSRVILVRYISQSEYGIYSLALVLMNIFVVISALGLSEGAARQIPFYRGQGDTQKVAGVVFSSLQIALITSVFLSLVLFFTSDIISTKIFHDPKLSAPLKIFSIAIPFSLMISIFMSIFRGFERADVKIYFQDILRNVLFLLFLVGAILLGLSFTGVIYAFLISIVITCIAFAVYAAKKLPIPIRGKIGAVNPLGKELLFFSLPILGVAMMQMIIQWTDTLMLGYFKTSNIVGLYNAALPLAHLLSIIILSVNFLYLPVISQLYSMNLMEEMKRSYTVLTKWIFLATLPIFFLLFLFPVPVLDFLFGSQYIGAAIPLQILALGFFIVASAGPISNSLMVMGETRFLMWSVLITAGINVALNVTLIPPLGAIGAAIASMSSVIVLIMLEGVRFYQLSKIHPFNKNYLKSIIISVILILAIYGFAKYFFTITFWMLPILLIVFMMIYILCLLLTKSFDSEDIMMLLTLEQRTGIDATRIKKVLRRFL